MEIDALNAGVKKGGLVSRSQIKILICYILDAVKEPVPAKTLSELLHYDGIANYFEVDSAFGVLLQNGQIEAADTAEETYIITEKGSRAAEELRTSLPFTIREIGCSVAVKMLNRIKTSRDYDIDVSETGNGYTVTCSVTERGIKMLSASVYVSDKQQAQTIKEAFLEKAGTVFSNMIDELTRSEE